ncbi:hypothetical protein AN964_01700 [Heyndrickxia shackletonii]|uniref:Uncharacterized protein n=1 Tax=Heyndrickxia shackletonii TaxID=157838 RepID=A0A0Q3TE87_9BACI|nr:hypothetical protein AN964_01700 [Heyndrickxia shackletonii]
MVETGKGYVFTVQLLLKDYVQCMHIIMMMNHNISLFLATFLCQFRRIRTYFSLHASSIS